MSDPRLFNLALKAENDALREQVRVLLAENGKQQETINRLAPSTAGEPLVIFKAGIRRERGWCYFVDENANISRRRKPAQKGYRDEVVIKTDIKVRPGYAYIINDQGDVEEQPITEDGER